MIKCYRKFIFITLILNCLLASCFDSDSTAALEEVFISEDKFCNYITGKKCVSIGDDILKKSNTIEELLAEQTSIYLRNNGNGNLSTPCFRGSAGRHTKILWNGLSISNAMNGVNDLNLISVPLVNYLNVQYGSSCALWGSGAIGGVIHLENKIDIKEAIKLKAGLKYGSFYTKATNISFYKGGSNIAYSADLFYNSSLNNYSFLNTTVEGNTKQKMSNSDYIRSGFIHQIAFKLSSFTSIDFKHLFQIANSNLVSSLKNLNSNSNQDDYTHRFLFTINHQKERIYNLFKMAFFRDDNIYTEKFYTSSYRNRLDNFQLNNENSFVISTNQFLGWGVNFSNYLSRSSSYNNSQNRLVIFLNYKVKNKENTLFALMSFRKEFVSSFSENPNAFYIGAEYKPVKLISFKANIASVYNLPGLNDLYWNPGGNVNLLTENGYSYEFILTVNTTGNDNNNKAFSLAFFNNKIDNWITWAPVPNLDYYTANNIDKVWSRGCELDWTYTFAVDKNIIISNNAKASRILSTVVKSNLQDVSYVGKQLAYTPKYKLNNNSSISIKSFTMSAAVIFTGNRFTNPENKTSLGPYTLVNLSLSKRLKSENYIFDFFFNIYNLLNETYELIEYYPMPFINFRSGLVLYLND